MEEECFTPKEIAERLKVTVPAVYNWIDREQLYAIKQGESVRIPAVGMRGIYDAVVEEMTATSPRDTQRDYSKKTLLRERALSTILPRLVFSAFGFVEAPLERDNAKATKGHLEPLQVIWVSRCTTRGTGEVGKLEEVLCLPPGYSAHTDLLT